MRQHLERCEPCRLHCAELDRTNELLDAFTVEAPPAPALEQWAALATADIKPRQPGGRRLLTRWWMAAAALVLAACMAGQWAHQNARYTELQTALGGRQDQLDQLHREVAAWSEELGRREVALLQHLESSTLAVRSFQERHETDVLLLAATLENVQRELNERLVVQERRMEWLLSSP